MTGLAQLQMRPCTMRLQYFKSIASRSHIIGCRFFGISTRIKVDPSSLVYGMTKERMDADPAVAEYMLANYPDAFESDSTLEAEEDDYIFKLHPLEVREKPSDLRKEKAKERRKVEKATHYPRNIRPLRTYLRDENREDGTRNSKRLRYQDKMIPGLLCGGDPRLGIISNQPESKTWIKTPWNILHRELVRYRHNFESRVYELTVHRDCDDHEGFEKHIVTPENVNRHPILETIYCANFVRYHPGRPLSIPVQYVNQEESPVLRRDGFIIPIQRTIQCLVEDEVDIPEAIEVECTGLGPKSVIRKDRLIIPEGVRLSDRVLKRGNDLVIGVVQGGGRSEDKTSEESTS